MTHTIHQPARGTGRTLALIQQMQQAMADGDVPFLHTTDIERFQRAFLKATGLAIACELVDTTQKGVFKDYTRVVAIGPAGEPVQSWLDVAEALPPVKPGLGRMYRITVAEEQLKAE